jgi:DNA-binding XRE family transcriptional regulator
MQAFSRLTGQIISTKVRVMDSKKEILLPAKLRRLGTSVRDGRKKLGLSLRELGDRVGVAKQTLQNVEQHRNWPSMPVYIELCRELGAGEPPMTETK